MPSVVALVGTAERQYFASADGRSAHLPLFGPHYKLYSSFLGIRMLLDA